MQLSQLLLIASKPATKWRVGNDLAYGPAPQMRLDVYRPPSVDANKLPVVLFWHGGSWTGGTKERYAFMGESLTKMGVVGVIVGYRKYPEVHFPTFIEDAAQAVKWVHSHISEYGGDPNQLMLMGHSAGAHTAALLAYRPSFLQAADVPSSAVRGFVGLAGPYDFYPGRRYKNAFPLKDPSQPWRLTSVEPGAPPALLLHGRSDFVVEMAQSTRFAKRLRKAGIRVRVRLYNRFEHFSLIGAYIALFRYLPGPWQITADFIHEVSQVDFAGF
jgi:acetyl esterase/lipase